MTLTIARNFLIALALVATAAPLAAASHSVCVNDHEAREYTCIDAGSSTYGSCDGPEGSGSTGVTLRRDTWGEDSYSYEQTSVTASCYAYTYQWDNETYTGSGNGIRVESWGYGSDGYHSDSVSWQQYEYDATWGSGSGCDTQTSIDGKWTSYGCPVGAPPRVPALLP